MNGLDVEFRLLGPLEVVREGQVVELGNGRERDLLGLLLLHANQVVPVDRLLDELWGENPPASANHALQVYVSTLRKRLEPDRARPADGGLIRTQRPGYLLVASADQIDAAAFEGEADAGRRALRDGRAEDAARLLRAALDRWRGPALADLAYESWAEGEASRLDQSRIATMEDRFDAELACGRHHDLVSEIDALARRHPLRERLWGQLMLALYRSGRQAEALRAADELRATLRDELGLDPSAEIRALERSMLDQDPGLGPAPAPPSVRPPPAPAAPAPAAAPDPPNPQAAVGPTPPETPLGSIEPRHDEQKVVTALFADLTGSTPLGEALEPEEFKVVVDEAVSRMMTAVSAYGGTVVSVAGDGILALFGAPTAHEDDAERAVRAGIDLVADVAAYGEEIARAWSVAPPTAHVGIHTGPVVLGSIGGGQVELTAMGDTVNVASRLESAAGSGTVLVGDSTRRSLEPLFEFGESRPHRLRGRRETVDASQVTGRRAVRGNVRGIEGVEVELVGRPGEIEAGNGAVDAVMTGTGGVLLLTGEAGMGKSRLLNELRHSFERGGDPDRPRHWLAGRSLSYGERLPYWPFRELLRDWLGVSAVEPELRVKVRLRSRLDAVFGASGQEIQPFLGNLLGLHLDADVAARVQSLSAQALQQATVGAVTRLLDRLAADGPVAVALDDLHWADGDSIALVEQLLALTESAAVLVIVAQRPEREHPSWAVHDLARRTLPHRTTEIVLGPLSAGDDATLLGALVGPTTLPPDLRASLLDTAEGNPFFLEELVRSLMAAGALARDGSGWRLDHEVAVDLPETVEKVIQSRIDRLPVASRATLTAASVLGRQFDVELLEATVDETAALHDSLRDLQREAMLREAQRWPRPEFRFRHSLIQETAYRTLVPSRRRELHLRAARALEARAGADGPADNSLLALHFEQAGELEVALRYHGRAAADASAMYARQTAFAHYDAALRLADQHGATVGATQAVVADLALGRGRVLRQMGDDAAAIADLRRALAAARSAGRNELEVAAATELGVSQLYRGTTVGQAVEGFEVALENAGAVGDRAAQATLLGRLSVESVRRLDFAGALTQAEDGVALGRSSGDEVAVTRALDGLKLVLLSLGDLASFRTMIVELEARLRQLGDDEFLQFARAEHAVEASAAGRWVEALALFDDAIELNHVTGGRADEPLLLSMRSNLQRAHGLYGAALHSAIEANRISVEASHHLWTTWASVNLCAVRLDLEDPEAAMRSLDQIARIWSDEHAAGASAIVDDQRLRMQAFSAYSQARLGRHEAAAEALAAVDQIRRQITLPPGRTYLYGFDGEVAAARAHLLLGERERAAAILDPLLVAAEQAGWCEAVAATSLALGQIAVAVADVDRARVHVQRCVEVSAAGGLPGLEWRAWSVAAGLHARGGGSAEVAEATEAAARADAGIRRLSASLGDSPRAAEFRQRAGRVQAELTASASTWV